MAEVTARSGVREETAADALLDGSGRCVRLEAIGDAESGTQQRLKLFGLGRVERERLLKAPASCDASLDALF